MDELIPIVGMILVLGPVASLAFSFTPLGRALVERIRGGAATPQEGLLDLQDEVDRLREQLGGQDERIEEIHDRLDFTERLLMQGKEREPEPSKEVATPV